ETGLHRRRPRARALRRRAAGGRLRAHRFAPDRDAVGRVPGAAPPVAPGRAVARPALGSAGPPGSSAMPHATRPRAPSASALLLAFGLALAAPPLAAQAPAQRAEVGRAADALRDKVVAWRRDFHQHPELGNRETRTAA